MPEVPEIIDINDQSNTPDWVKKDVVPKDVHTEILSLIENKERKGLEVPLHYQLYKHLSVTGELPDYIHKNPISTQHETAIKSMIPDLTMTIFKLEQNGYKIKTVNQDTDTESLKDDADALTKTINNSYPHPFIENESLYPIKEGMSNVVFSQLQAGKQFSWILEDTSGKTVAVTSLIKKQNFIEGGRTGTNHDRLRELKQQDLSLRGFMQLRLLNLLAKPENFDITSNNTSLYMMDIRCTSFVRKNTKGEVITSSGKNVQGSWFGGMNHQPLPVDVGLGIVGGAWLYTIGNKNETYEVNHKTTATGGVEPVMRTVMWLDKKTATKNLERKIIWAPDKKTENQIKILLSTFTDIKQLKFGRLPNPEDGTETIITSGFDNTIPKVYTSFEIGEDEQAILLSNAVNKIEKEGTIPAIESRVECTTALNADEIELQKMTQTIKNHLGLGFVSAGIFPNENGGLSITFVKQLHAAIRDGMLETNLPNKYYNDTRLKNAANEIRSIFGELQKTGLKTNSNFN